MRYQMAGSGGRDEKVKGKKLYSYQDMRRDLRCLAIDFPDRAKVFWLAETADGNRIYGIRLGNPASLCHVAVQASMHAREWLNTELLMQMVRHCCENYESGHYQGVPYQELFSHSCFWVLPMVNPDGVFISQYGIGGLCNPRLKRLVQGMAGKHTGRWKANARGVDLNRNYSVGFGQGTAKKRGSASYAGKNPFSERETRALAKLILRIRPKAVINYHETGHQIFYREDSALAYLMKGLTGYRLCPEKGSPNGSLGDWLSEKKIPWCTIETCRGRAPVSRRKLKAELRRNNRIFPALAYCCLDIQNNKLA